MWHDGKDCVAVHQHLMFTTCQVNGVVGSMGCVPCNF